MKKFKTLLITILAVVVFALCTACGGGTDNNDNTPVDYVSNLKLDLSSDTKKQEVTVRLYVDGDTTHFDPVTNSTIATNPSSDFAKTEGYIKARYIAINTPESTGKIEEWGKAASKFTRGKLENAQSIIVESDDDKWNIDSSGSFRYVVWVWYMPKGESEYRNLNLEILQEGLALGSSVTRNRYGDTALSALMQAQDLKRYVYSGEKDPDFPYGDATPITLKELRCNIADYEGKKVKVDGLVTAEFNDCVYIEDNDPESGVYFGIQVYYSYNPGKLLEILNIGNRVSVVGVVQYYEAGDTYQISSVKYDRFHPDDPNNTQLVSEGTRDDVTFTEVSAKDIVSSKLTVSWVEETEDEEGNASYETVEKELDHGYAIWHTSVTVKNLTVTDIYTTPSGNSAGAMSITCMSEDGVSIVVRTEVLKDENGELITEEAYAGKTITVKGIVDKFNGKYQVKVYLADYIEVLD